MKIILPSFKILSSNIDDVLEDMEYFGRAYDIFNSNKGKVTKDSARKFVKNLIKNHKSEALLAYFHLSIKFTCDRIFADELVRLRNEKSFSDVFIYESIEEEDEGLEFIWPYIFGEYNEENATQEASMHWQVAMLECERRYRTLLKLHYNTQQASFVLPRSIKTEVDVTGTYQDWRRFLYRYAARCDGVPRPEMEELTVPLLQELTNLLPELFADIYVK